MENFDSYTNLSKRDIFVGRRSIADNFSMTRNGPSTKASVNAKL